MEMELKEIVRLSYSVGSIESRPVQDLPAQGTHSLHKLLSIVDSNLDTLGLAEQPFLTKRSRDLIADLEKFGRKGEALRFPEETKKQGGQPTMPERFVADVPAVMRIVNEFQGKFAGAIGYLDHREQTLPRLVRKAIGNSSII
jgi:hypothetical protein